MPLLCTVQRTGTGRGRRHVKREKNKLKYFDNDSDTSCENKEQNNENTVFSFFHIIEPSLCSCILFPTTSLPRSHPSLKGLPLSPHPMGRSPGGHSLTSPGWRLRPHPLQPSLNFQPAYLWTHKSGFMVGDIPDCLVPYEPLVNRF